MITSNLLCKPAPYLDGGAWALINWLRLSANRYNNTSGISSRVIYEACFFTLLCSLSLFLLQTLFVSAHKKTLSPVGIRIAHLLKVITQRCPLNPCAFMLYGKPYSNTTQDLTPYLKVKTTSDIELFCLLQEAMEIHLMQISLCPT